MICSSVPSAISALSGTCFTCMTLSSSCARNRADQLLMHSKDQGKHASNIDASVTIRETEANEFCMSRCRTKRLMTQAPAFAAT